MSMTRRKRMQRAERFFAIGLDFLELEFHTDAMYYFHKSIKMYPTAESYTYLGWSLALLGDFDKAIEFCKVASTLDPDYGNPYNDIGTYLLEQDEIDEAIPYLRQAAKARRYDARYFAHYNLGRALERKYAYDKAVTEYKRSMDLNPEYQPARDAYFKLVRMMN